MNTSVRVLQPTANLISEQEKHNSAAELLFRVEVSNTSASLEQATEEHVITFSHIYNTIKVAAHTEQSLTLSTEEVRTLLGIIDELIESDVEAFLSSTSDPEADAADERAFVQASRARFLATDDPADSVYDDL